MNKTMMITFIVIVIIMLMMQFSEQPAVTSPTSAFDLQPTILNLS